MANPPVGRQAAQQYLHASKPMLICWLHAHHYKGLGHTATFEDIASGNYRECPRCAKAKTTKLVREVVKKLEGWYIAEQYRGSNGRSLHTVETDGHGGYRCTCQGFRIRKTGECKHTRQAAIDARRR